ncbi:MAG: RNA polymerase factor sigma-54 [Armatimonadota bacterium]
MLFEQSLKQSLSQKIDPKLIMANNILQLSNIELHQLIEQELAENPALELPEEDACENCNKPKSECETCPFAPKIEIDDIDISKYEIEQPVDFAADYDEESDFVANVRSEVTLQDYLSTSVRAIISNSDYDIADYIISNINDSGYLEGQIEEFALDLGCSIEDIERILSIIQTMDPPGVGARDLRECLKLQLIRLAEDGEGNKIALEMVENFWQEMLSGKFNKIARALKVNIEHILRAEEYIKTSLTPYPGSAFRPPFANDPSDFTSTVKPDVIVKRTNSGFEIEINGYDQYVLNVNSSYRDMYEKIKEGKNSFSNEDKKHITEFVERADLFIKYINERRRTLRNITKYIVEYQQGYIETGSKAFLRPLTRTQIAKRLNMHESTVSRATANKYIQLPSEEVISFDFFFESATSVKDMIMQMIAEEDKSNPLSDQQIADILKEKGFDVARRTVVKYRESQKILSSRQRRR